MNHGKHQCSSPGCKTPQPFQHLHANLKYKNNLTVHQSTINQPQKHPSKTRLLPLLIPIAARKHERAWCLYELPCNIYLYHVLGHEIETQFRILHTKGRALSARSSAAPLLPRSSSTGLPLPRCGIVGGRAPGGIGLGGTSAATLLSAGGPIGDMSPADDALGITCLGDARRPMPPASPMSRAPVIWPVRGSVTSGIADIVPPWMGPDSRSTDSSFPACPTAACCPGAN